MVRKKPHYNRQRIINENLLQYIDLVGESERNKEVIKWYTSGASYKEIASKYGISNERVAQIVSNYIRHTCLYRKRIETE